MTSFQIIAALLTFAALGGYINHRFLKLPTTIGHMAFALAVSLFFLALSKLDWIDLRPASIFVEQIDFSAVLLHGMLSFLLFAGALHISLKELKSVAWSVGVLATIGVAIATFVTGSLVWWAASLLGMHLPYIYALLFGALIAPTDPIAVLAILKETGMSKTLYAKVGGESLFNDGVGIVVFTTILSIALNDGEPSAAGVANMFLKEAVGGLLIGGALGFATSRLLSTIDDYKVEALMTLGLVTGGYAIAEYVHVSAPICMVAAGLIVGSYGHPGSKAAERNRKYLDIFWELIDEVLNAVLFMLIGLEIIIISLTPQHILLGLIAIAAVLAGRLISVVVPISAMRLKKTFERGATGILVWGGLRGGLAIAMALSLPHVPEKSVIVPITYIVVLFSILVQGLSFKRVLAFLTRH